MPGGPVIPYEVKPALEYRTFAHVFREPCYYAGVSVRHDGRVLAVGTNRGVVLWDLARGTELAFLPIGNRRQVMFDPSGDLITSGSMGVLRWPIQLDPEPGESRIGPPKSLPLPAGNCRIAEDRSGRIVAKADHEVAYVATARADDPHRSPGRLPLCQPSVRTGNGWRPATTRRVAVPRSGAPPMATEVFDLPINYGTGVEFSPDGKWLMTGTAPVPALGSRHLARGAARSATGAGFSPDGRLIVVQEASKVIRLVETETGRTLARLESPDLCVWRAAFSPDGSRLVVTTKTARPCTSGTCGPFASTWPAWASTGMHPLIPTRIRLTRRHRSSHACKSTTFITRMKRSSD